jgi:hypothetical protein
LSQSVRDASTRKAFVKNSSIGADYFFVAKPALRSLNNGIRLEARDVRQIGCAVLQAAYHDVTSNSLITCLLFAGGPSTIFWRVRPVVVDPIQ